MDRDYSKIEHLVLDGKQVRVRYRNSDSGEPVSWTFNAQCAEWRSYGFVHAVTETGDPEYLSQEYMINAQIIDGLLIDVDAPENADGMRCKINIGKSESYYEMRMHVHEITRLLVLNPSISVEQGKDVQCNLPPDFRI